MPLSSTSSGRSARNTRASPARLRSAPCLQRHSRRGTTSGVSPAGCVCSPRVYLPVMPTVPEVLSGGGEARQKRFGRRQARIQRWSEAYGHEPCAIRRLGDQRACDRPRPSVIHCVQPITHVFVCSKVEYAEIMELFRLRYWMANALDAIKTVLLASVCQRCASANRGSACTGSVARDHLARVCASCD